MSHIKIAIGAVVIIALLVAAKGAHTAIYNAGWNAAIVTQDLLIEQEKQAAVAKAFRQWENMNTIAEDNIVIEERIVEKVRTIEKKIPIVVERIVEVTPECRDLGDDFAGLLNAQVNSRPGPGLRSPSD